MPLPPAIDGEGIMFLVIHPAVRIVHSSFHCPVNTLTGGTSVKLATIHHVFGQC